ncbi:MAG: 16S rRNA (adenine(1518)-N(6)/adenine(1519)-N(6))-dimethyltransferase RsmA [Desulfotignum sp.]
MKENQIYAGKEMGQNFLSNPETARMIVEQTGIDSHARVLEIGPGLGALTIPIAQKTRHVTVVEKDRRLIPLLAQALESHGIDWVRVLNQDFLKTDIASLAEGQKLLVMGNLPYNISSQILFRLIRSRQMIDTACLMFQRELADRILATPGSKAYSRLSVVAQYAAKIRRVIDIGPGAFFPKPAVDSTVLSFEFFSSRPFSEDMELRLFTVIKAAFSKRRKSLKNSLVGPDLGLDKSTVAKALAGADIVPERRAETLGVEEFERLTRAVDKLLAFE